MRPINESEARCHATGRPSRRLVAGITLGAGIGLIVGVLAALILVFALGAVRFGGELAWHAYLYLGFEGGFLGAVLGGTIVGMRRLYAAR